MATASNRLTAGHVNNGGSLETYTAPAGHRVIVKSVVIENSNAFAGTFVLRAIAADGSGSPAFVQQPITAGQALSIQFWSVLREGDKLFAAAYGADYSFWVSGAELPST